MGPGESVCSRVVCISCFVAAAACAADPLSAQAVMSEADALARLSADSPRVRAIRSGIDLARADVLSANRWPNPRLYVGRESVAGVTETITTVLQPLPITGQRRFETASATALLEATTNRADEGVRRARADLRIAYADLVTAQTRERELTAARDHLQELVGILEKRERAGDAAAFDRLRAQREAIDFEADRVMAGADRARAQGRLASYFAAGIEPSAIVAASPVIAPRDLPPLGVLVDQAERTRGEALALQGEIEAARFALRAAERRRVPEPEVLGGTKSSSLGAGDVGSVISIQAVLPLFDRSGPEKARAQGRAAAAAARLETFRIALRGEIAAWRAAAVERRSAADRYRASALSTAGDVERIARGDDRAGGDDRRRFNASREI